MVVRAPSGSGAFVRLIGAPTRGSAAGVDSGRNFCFGLALLPLVRPLLAAEKVMEVEIVRSARLPLQIRLADVAPEFELPRGECVIFACVAEVGPERSRRWGQWAEASFGGGMNCRGPTGRHGLSSNWPIWTI